MPPILQIRHLTHAYARRTALSDLSLDIADGEIFGFLGPNGSGKTTLFRILSTLLPIPPGHVTILGDDLATHRDALRHHLGVIFQSPSLDKQLTAEENLRHHGHLYGLRGPELRRRIDEMLARFDLADRRNEYISAFSGGMRRRVELAKGLLTRPRIFLMDEPSTGLDPAARIEMWNALRDARQRDGVTILVTTHLMEEAEKCDRLAVMNHGSIVAMGTPGELKEKIGGDVITVTGKDLQRLREAIAEKFSIAAEPIDGALRIERPRAHDFVPQLVEALPGMIESISVGKPTLEDVFIHVTGQRLSDSNK